jgi:hypothetical protein
MTAATAAERRIERTMGNSGSDVRAPGRTTARVCGARG